MRCLAGVLGGLALALLLVGCDREQAADRTETDDPIAAALAAPERPEADRERDGERKPAEILRFFGIEPGQTVFEFYSGSGWYSEILARVLGDEGQLEMHNNPLFRKYFAEELEARNIPGRFDNVAYREVAPRALMLEPDRYDRILVILAYHDVLYPPEPGAPAPDRARLMSEFYDGLRPGGILGIVDHVGPSDLPPREQGEELHRVDPTLVREEAEAAGFVFDDASDVLANSEDGHRLPVFEVERGTTDRFVYRFRKPEAEAKD